MTFLARLLLVLIPLFVGLPNARPCRDLSTIPGLGFVGYMLWNDEDVSHKLGFRKFNS